MVIGTENIISNTLGSDLFSIKIIATSLVGLVGCHYFDSSLIVPEAPVQQLGHTTSHCSNKVKT